MTFYDLSARLRALGLSHQAIAYRVGVTRLAIGNACRVDGRWLTALVDALERLDSAEVAAWAAGVDKQK